MKPTRQERIDAIVNLSTQITDAITHAPEFLDERDIALAIEEALVDAGLKDKIKVER